MNKNTQQKNIRKLFALAFNIPIGLLHFVTGHNYKGPFPVFVNGYLIDILFPFGFYFLLCLCEHSIYNRYKRTIHWSIKWILIFSACSSVEIAQFFGAPLFGRTFDPIDFIMYGIGTSMAAILDVLILSRSLRLWNLNN